MNNRIILKRTPQSECFEVMINESSLISWINLYEMNNNPTSIEATIFSSIQLQCKQENILPESILTSAPCFRGKHNLGYVYQSKLLIEGCCKRELFCPRGMIAIPGK